jgi:toxin ParE1/3/4
MDYKVIWDDEAIDELGRAVRWIARHNPVAARNTGEAILQKVASLGQFPEIGKVFRKLNRHDVREIPVPPYRIIYRVQEAERCVRVLKVWHGARREPKIQ